jgi:SAM-dependent methyltransferase
MTENYESKYWGLIYDQMMEGHLSGWLENNRAYYRSHLAGVDGPVLDCACGTGLMLLPLLEQGLNAMGFDASDSMLSRLRKKAHQLGLADIDERISKQSLQTFSYSLQFDAVIIPTNSFVLLTTQEDQIACLRNVHSHLSPGGRLLLDIRVTSLPSPSDPATVSGNWYTWKHPETGKPIRQKIDQIGCDPVNQLTFDRCFFEHGTDSEEFPMTSRSVSPSEFQLLLRLAGFKRWDVWGGPDRESLTLDEGDAISYWRAYKE